MLKIDFDNGVHLVEHILSDKSSVYHVEFQSNDGKLIMVSCIDVNSAENIAMAISRGKIFTRVEEIDLMYQVV